MIIKSPKQNRRFIFKTEQAISTDDYSPGFLLTQTQQDISMQGQSPKRQNIIKKKSIQLFHCPSTGDIFDQYQINYRLLQQSQKLILDMPTNQEHLPQNIQKTSPIKSPLQIIDLDESNNLTVYRFTFGYFRFKIHKKQSPLQIFLKGNMSTLKILASTSVTHPTIFNNDFIIKTSYYKYHDPRSNYFLDTYLYLSIYSNIDATFQVQFSFGETKHLKQIEIEDEEQRRIRFERYRFYMEMNRTVVKTDKIIQNVDLIKSYRESKEEKLKKQKQIHTQRIELVVQKKKDILSDKLLEFKSKQSASDLLKEIYHKNKQSQIKKENLTKIVQYWHKQMSFLTIINLVKQKINESKIKQKRLAKGRWIVWQFSFNYLIRIKAFGQNMHQRTIFKARSTLRIYSTQIQKQSKIKAANAILYYFRKTCMLYRFQHKHNLWSEKINYIKKSILQFKSKMKKYKETVHRLISSQYTETLSQLGVQIDAKKFRMHIIDTRLLNLLIERYIKSRKAKLRNKNNLTFILTIMQKYTLYGTPTQEEIKQILRSYAIQKKIINE